MQFPTFIPTTAAVIRVLEVASLAAVSNDPMQAVRLAMIAAEIRDRPLLTLKSAAGGAR